MIVELWLIWALVNEKPADVDSFLNKDQCEQSLQAAMQRLDETKQSAIAGKAPKEVMDRLNSMTYYGCTRAQAGFKQDAS